MSSALVVAHYALYGLPDGGVDDDDYHIMLMAAIRAAALPMKRRHTKYFMLNRRMLMKAITGRRLRAAANGGLWRRWGSLRITRSSRAKVKAFTS